MLLNSKQMKSIKSILFLPIVIMFLLSACAEKKVIKPSSKGKTLEMLVVTNNKEQWNGFVGTQIKEFFGQEILGLPQSEPMFTFFHLPEDAFLDMYKPNRDILIVDISASFETAQLETRKDHWAAPQRIFKITAPDLDGFTKIFEENKYIMMELYNQVERRRILEAFKFASSVKIKKILEDKMKLSLTFPGNFNISKQDSNFIWIRKESLKDSQGIMIYIEDYSDMNKIDPRYILRKRNLVTRKYIPGPSTGSYMKVADEFIKPISKDINFNDLFAVETRALWDVQNDFMGGPLLNYTIIDEKRNRIITIDAYVYAPNKSKKKLMKELEAIAYSLKLVD